MLHLLELISPAAANLKDAYYVNSITAIKAACRCVSTCVAATAAAQAAVAVGAASATSANRPLFPSLEGDLNSNAPLALAAAGLVLAGSSSQREITASLVPSLAASVKPEQPPAKKQKVTLKKSGSKPVKSDSPCKTLKKSEGKPEKELVQPFAADLHAAIKAGASKTLANTYTTVRSVLKKAKEVERLVAAKVLT
ncbi:hypothetical protein EsH8_XIII_000044 [Colletotrichum jinshuiense]